MPNSANRPTLLATYWTLAGPIRPLTTDEISPWPLEERARNAAEAGFTGFGLSHADLMSCKARLGFDGIAQVLADNGLTHVEFEPMYDWWTTGERRAASDRVKADLLEAMAAIDAPDRFIKCAPDLTGGSQTKEEYAAGVATIAADARQAGGRVGVETLPFSDLRFPADGLAILDMVRDPAVGIVLDIWHVVRGGVPIQSLADIPADHIAHVELNDAEAEPVGSLAEDTLDHRRLPGRGAFDVPAFLRAIQATGYSGTYGVEILSEEQRARPLEEAARLAVETALEQFELAAGRDQPSSSASAESSSATNSGLL